MTAHATLVISLRETIQATLDAITESLIEAGIMEDPRTWPYWMGPSGERIDDAGL